MRLLAALLLVVDGWMLLVAAARRLPPGLARDLAGFLPDCVTLLRRLRRDPRVPRRSRVALGLAALWVLSPVDLLPEFLPVVGPLDDVVVVALALRYALRQVPSAAVREAWPGSMTVLDRLLGHHPASTVAADGDGRGVGDGTG
jgi:uncharacterized membrane protein YkvA (DUF1232 family)